MGLLNTGHLEKFANGFAEKVNDIFLKKIDVPETLPASGGDADTVTGHTVGTDVPKDAVFTDTVYTHPTDAGNKHVPAGGVAGQILKCNNEGTPEWAPETDTTYSVMTAATASSDGEAGLVPAPGKGKQNSFLKGDGEWEEMIETTDEEIDAIIEGTFEQGGNE